MRKKKINLPLRIVFISIALSPVIFLALRYLGFALRDLDYFKIREVVALRGKAGGFSYLMGRNIFSIDLKEESRYISQIYPAYSKIRINRILPNRLFIDFFARRPLAYIKLSRYYCVDNEAVLFDQLAPDEEGGLPLIVGLENKILAPHIGNKYNIKELSLALEMINEIKNYKRLAAYQVKIINVVNPNAAFIILGDGPQILLGQGGVKNKVHILDNLLRQVEADLAKIKYIDLRFNDPVIKFKDVP